jgi:hypothetical protein
VLSDEKYIRGWRQLEALWLVFVAIKRRNFPMLKRELEIMSGFAKPFKVFMMCGACGESFPYNSWDGTVIKDTGQFVCLNCSME